MTRIRDATGRRRDMGLGNYPEVTLKEAREKAADLRRQVRDGLDPVAERRKHRNMIPTFKRAAESVFEERKAVFKSLHHQNQWIASVRTYAFPQLGNYPVNEITGPMIVRCLKPIWTSYPETARRILQRIATIIAWAAAHGHREHEAPLRAIRMGLPPQQKGKKHFAAVPYKIAPQIMEKLRALPESNARNCLAFVILTGCRSGEARGGKWNEVDFEAATWTIPADRIKMKVQHVVPLSPPALQMLQRLHAIRTNDYIFAGLPQKRRVGADKGVALSIASLLQALAEVAPNVTVHGWRSTFRDWTSEETAFPSEVAEKALAHQIPSAVERAYRRGDLLEKRRQLMNAWAAYLAGRSADVVPIRSVAA
jgi:integrase